VLQRSRHGCGGYTIRLLKDGLFFEQRGALLRVFFMGQQAAVGILGRGFYLHQVGDAPLGVLKGLGLARAIPPPRARLRTYRDKRHRLDCHRDDARHAPPTRLIPQSTCFVKQALGIRWRELLDGRRFNLMEIFLTRQDYSLTRFLPSTSVSRKAEKFKRRNLIASIPCLLVVTSSKF